MKDKIKAKDWAYAVLLNLVGVFMYAVGINCFAVPHKIAPGGASGIAILVNYISGFPIGFFVFIFNIPLLLIIVIKKYFQWVFIVKTLVTSALLSVMTDYVAVMIPGYKGNALLAAMFGGAMMGVGLALVHMGSSNTGGVSLMGLIIQKLKPQFKVGTLVSILNIVIVLMSGIVYRNIDSLLYAVVTVYISGVFMNNLLQNVSTKCLMIVIAESTDKVRQVFLNKRKGVTVLKGEGGYSSETQRVVLCAADRNECQLLQKEVEEVDSQALIIITETSKVVGKGFKHLM